MIIGKGLIAQLFLLEDREDTLFFASGVSNSLEDRKEAFLREETLLMDYLKENPEKLFVYFSSCSVYDSSKYDSPYVLHKLRMERLVEQFASRYLILRVSNAVGKGGNPNLLMNYLFESVKNNKEINVHTLATRNLIDAEDVKNITLKLIEQGPHNCIINLAYLENFSTLEILENLEKSTGKAAITKLSKKGQTYKISIPEIENYFIENGLTDKSDYLCRIITKYYSS